LNCGASSTRLGETLAYVWRKREFKQTKLDAFRRLLLEPASTAAGQQAGQSTGRPPLLVMEHFRREEDFLGESYALGITSSLSLGLPHLPHGNPPAPSQTPKLACAMGC
jgi:hypothetical protein